MAKAFGAVIEGGQMPVQGVIPNQVQHLHEENQRLTQELNLALAQRDMLSEQLREANDRIAWLHEASWQRAGVRDDGDGTLIKTV